MLKFMNESEISEKPFSVWFVVCGLVIHMTYVMLKFMNESEISEKLISMWSHGLDDICHVEVLNEFVMSLMSEYCLI